MPPPSGHDRHRALCDLRDALADRDALDRRTPPSTRTSNLVPLAAMLVAALWLHEPMTPAKFVAVALIIAGVVLTRLQPRVPVGS